MALLNPNTQNLIYLMSTYLEKSRYNKRAHYYLKRCYTELIQEEILSEKPERFLAARDLTRRLKQKSLHG